jgi:hypothetical protein
LPFESDPYKEGCASLANKQNFEADFAHFSQFSGRARADFEALWGQNRHGLGDGMDYTDGEE